MKYIFLLASMIAATAYAADNRIYIPFEVQRANSTATFWFFVYPHEKCWEKMEDAESRHGIIVTELRVLEPGQPGYIVIPRTSNNLFSNYIPDSQFTAIAYRDNNKLKHRNNNGSKRY